MGAIALFILSSLAVITNHTSTARVIAIPHAIYVSVIEIEQGVDKKSGSIKVKIFANDLEDAIFNQNKVRIELSEADCSQNKAIVAGYFKEHLILKINTKEQAYTLQSCEVNDLSIWFTFTFNTSSSWRDVGLTADYLIELFPTQSNVVRINVNNEKRMFRLAKGATSETVTFKE